MIYKVAVTRIIQNSRIAVLKFLYKVQAIVMWLIRGICLRRISVKQNLDKIMFQSSRRFCEYCYSV